MGARIILVNQAWLRCQQRFPGQGCKGDPVNFGRDVSDKGICCWFRGNDGDALGKLF